MNHRRLIISILCLSAIMAASAGWITYQRATFSSDQLLLLVPDDMNTSDPYVTMWRNAAEEEGLHLVPVHDSEFLRPVLRHSTGAGVILPDSFHQRASDVLVLSLQHFVASGGKLFLIYDAGTLLPNGGYASEQSRLSQLAGIPYARYDTFGDKTMRWSAVHGPSIIFDDLDVPPGKYYPFRKTDAINDNTESPDRFETLLRRYKYGDLEYPSFVTSGDYAGNILLRSAAGIAAGEHAYGRGSVLFVNLPLTYLKANTDGLMLHGFLRYFATHTIGLPRFLAVPDGIGGLVLNWHVDSNAAIEPMQEMDSWGLLKQGPYSVHITAGPDMMVPGDRRGFDVKNNVVGQDLLREYIRRGYAIGSHGGWIHNYFASHVDKDDPRSLEQYLALNKSALEEVSKVPVVEYSAPDGNQPDWVTRWLEAHGFIAYYFTGDTGMGPTQEYQRDSHKTNSIWAFPILHLDRAAGFEELSSEEHPAEEVQGWLEAITDFVTAHRVVRLIYFHPPGILSYHDVVERWLSITEDAYKQQTFRWYTMTQIAEFLNDRKSVKWWTDNDNGVLVIHASHPHTLAHFSWQLPADRYGQPEITQGSANVRRARDTWIVTAESDVKLIFQAQVLSQ